MPRKVFASYEQPPQAIDRQLMNMLPRFLLQAVAIPLLCRSSNPLVLYAFALNHAGTHVCAYLEFETTELDATSILKWGGLTLSVCPANVKQLVLLLRQPVVLHNTDNPGPLVKQLRQPGEVAPMAFALAFIACVCQTCKRVHESGCTGCGMQWCEGPPADGTGYVCLDCLVTFCSHTCGQSHKHKHKHKRICERPHSIDTVRAATVRVAAKNVFHRVYEARVHDAPRRELADMMEPTKRCADSEMAPQDLALVMETRTAAKTVEELVTTVLDRLLPRDIVQKIVNQTKERPQFQLTCPSHTLSDVMFWFLCGDASHRLMYRVYLIASLLAIPLPLKI